MDFFDNAVNKAKEAFDIARQKTGEVVQTGKQKFDIASIEAKRVKDFEALGKAYYESVMDSDDLDGEIKELVEEIKAKTEKINALRDELSGDKDKKICPKCGASVDNLSLYCNICGEKLG